RALRACLHVRARRLRRDVLRRGGAAVKRLTLAAVALLALAVPSQAFAEDFHPEDEFQLHAWVPIHIGPLDLSINKAVAYLMLGTLLSILLGIVFMRVRIGVRPGVRQTVGEQIYEVAQTQIAEQGLPSKAIGLWFPYVATLLIFIWLISLSVRLFANMLAGHMLILVMIGLVFVIHTPPWRFLGLPAALIFYAFEVVIVVSIQAFIFAALSAIYIGSAIEPEH